MSKWRLVQKLRRLRLHKGFSCKQLGLLTDIPFPHFLGMEGVRYISPGCYPVCMYKNVIDYMLYEIRPEDTVEGEKYSVVRKVSRDGVIRLPARIVRDMNVHTGNRLVKIRMNYISQQVILQNFFSYKMSKFERWRWAHRNEEDEADYQFFICRVSEEGELQFPQIIVKQLGEKRLIRFSRYLNEMYLTKPDGSTLIDLEATKRHIVNWWVVLDQRK